MDQTRSLVDQMSSPEAKIALFRALFRGRDDVYPRRFESRRRKDQLLQENGYLVVRYLAEDLAKELDSVLDGILRSLSSRRPAVVSTHTVNIVRGSRP